MNSVIEQIYRDQGFVGPDGAEVKPFPVSIKRNEGDALYRIVRRIKPSMTVEVGMAFGLSTLFICQALRDNGTGVHVAMDPYQSQFRKLGLYNVKRAGLDDLLTFHEEPSQLALARMAAQKLRAELVFIDGSHLFDAAFVDYYFADMLLPVGGIMVFDDLWMPAIRKVLRFVLRNRRYEIAGDLMGPLPGLLRRHVQNVKYQTRKRLKGKRNLGAGSEMDLHQGRHINWCIIRKTGEDDRTWDHFRPF
jgi:predicted O-methyltransferase YrrM